MKKPGWELHFSEETGSVTPFSYVLYVDGITGEVLGALNDKSEPISLPIDREQLNKPRETSNEEDLRKFFSFISDGKYDLAVTVLSYNLCQSDEAVQMWRENFSSIKSLKVVSIEQCNLEQWTSTREYYKVTLDIQTDGPFEKYGWENGVNVRWVSIIPQGAGLWKVDAFATSP